MTPAPNSTPDAPPLTRRIQRLIQRVRAFDRRHPSAWDLLLTGFFVTAALIDYGEGGWQTIAHNANLPDWLVCSMSLGLSVPLLWRRRHPLPVLTAMSLIALANSLTGAVLQAALLQFFLVFNIALRLPLKTLWWAAVLVVGPSVAGALRFPDGGWDGQVIPAIWVFSVVALLGIAVRTRRDYTEALLDRARRLEVERDQQAQLAAAAERTRIAREMHDIIGHNLSVITGLADGGRYAAAKSPERAVQALDAISTTSRTALTELRRLLGVLRDDEPPAAELTPQPTLTDLHQLMDGVRAAGLPVRMTVSRHPDSVPPPGPGQQLTVYRVVQEALTNTLKHAGPDATAEVNVNYTPQAITATITDKTTSTHTSIPSPEGRGITGMRERTALYEGTLETGARPTGGWRIHLHLPRNEDPEP
ncbi:histidine kinase [Streptomyces sp. NPDC002994]|uniref:sensor histidine kinase n=1 Tax=Streptomyces sp. NPDC002994 TaxID=3154441 RepID=UPI0033B3CA65